MDENSAGRTGTGTELPQRPLRRVSEKVVLSGSVFENAARTKEPVLFQLVGARRFQLLIAALGF